MNDPHPNFRIVEQSPWNKASAYKPDCIEMLRRRKPPTWLETLIADWRDILSEVRGSPYSHTLVALGAITFWTLILVAPLLIGAAR